VRYLGEGRTIDFWKEFEGCVRVNFPGKDGGYLWFIFRIIKRNNERSKRRN
jgi:hypothetical protein